MSQSDTKTFRGPRAFGARDKLGYGIGDAADTFFFTFVGSYLLVFYTDVYGISPAFVGALIFGAKIWEAFADVAWGRFIDTRREGKHGKFRPWLLRTSFPLAVAGVMLFLPISGAGDTFYQIYAAVTYLVWATLGSTFSIPFGALASVISSKPQHRTVLSTYRSLGITVANVAVLVIVPLVIFVDNKVSGDRFFLAALAFGLLSLLGYLLCYRFVVERVTAPSGQQNYRSFLGTVKFVFTSRLVIVVFLTTAIFLVTVLFFMAIAVYLFKDYFKQAQALSWVGGLQAVTALILFPIMGRLTSRFGKAETAKVGLTFGGAAFLILVFVPNISFVGFLLILTIGMFGMSSFLLIMFAFVTDAIDYHEYVNGLKEDGTLYSLYSIARRLGQGAAAGVSGAVLAWIGYSGELDTQSDSTLQSIHTLSTLVPAIGLLFMAGLFHFVYPLNKAKTQRLYDELARRRAEHDENS